MGIQHLLYGCLGRFESKVTQKERRCCWLFLSSKNLFRKFGSPRGRSPILRFSDSWLGTALVVVTW